MEAAEETRKACLVLRQMREELKMVGQSGNGTACVLSVAFVFFLIVIDDARVMAHRRSSTQGNQHSWCCLFRLVKDTLFQPAPYVGFHLF